MKLYRRKSMKGRNYGRKKKTAYRSKRKLRKMVRKFVRSERHQQVNVKLNPAAIFTTPTNVATTFVTASNAMTLDQCVGYTNYAAVFQYYRINKVVYRFMPMNDNQDLVSTVYSGGTYKTPKNAGELYTVIDHSDATSAAGINEFRAYQNVKITQSGRKITRVITPAILIPGYQSGISWGYVPKFKQWIRTPDTSVPHYGIKWAVYNEDSSPEYMPRWRIDAIVYISFKNPIPGYTSPLVDKPLLEEVKEEEDDDADIVTVTQEEEAKHMTYTPSANPAQAPAVPSITTTPDLRARAVPAARAVAEKNNLIKRTLSQHFIDMSVKDKSH